MKTVENEDHTISVSRSSVAKLVALVAFIAVLVSPYVEKLDGQSALVFMLSHYSLALAGLLLGIYFVKWPRWLWIPGVALLVLWHVPLLFDLSARLLTFRVPEEASILVGGLLVGSSFLQMKPKLKLSLFGGWLLADSALSAIFIVAPNVYSSLPASPFASDQFVITGVSMVIFMNLAIAYIVSIYVRHFQKMQRALNNSELIQEKEP